MDGRVLPQILMLVPTSYPKVEVFQKSQKYLLTRPSNRQLAVWSALNRISPETFRQYIGVCYGFDWIINYVATTASMVREDSRTSGPFEKVKIASLFYTLTNFGVKRPFTLSTFSLVFKLCRFSLRLLEGLRKTDSNVQLEDLSTRLLFPKFSGSEYNSWV